MLEFAFGLLSQQGSDGRKCGVSGFARVCAQAGKRGRAVTRANGSGSDSGDHGNCAASGKRERNRSVIRVWRIAGRRGAGAAFRETERIAVSAADQYVWQRAADVSGV